MKKSLWLARLLHTKGPQTKQQILNAWSTQDENGRPMAQSTFYDNCKYVAQQMGLNIKLQSDGKYHITNPDGVDQILTQMLCESQTDTTSTADLVLIYCRQIMEAIDLRQRLHFEYKSTHTAPYLTTFEPYCVRTIRNFIILWGTAITIARCASLPWTASCRSACSINTIPSPRTSTAMPISAIVLALLLANICIPSVSYCR